MMKKKIIAILSCLTIMSACLAISFSTTAASANTVSLFYSDGVEFTTHQQVPADKIAGDDRYGLKMTADHNGESAKFYSDIIGKCEIDFAVFSQNSFEGEVGSVIYSNEYADIRELSFCFTDSYDPQNSFEVLFNAGFSGNCVTPIARVRARGQDAGIVNLSGELQAAITTLYNRKGIYTAIEGSSFSNRAYINGELTNNVRSIILTFDPSTMSVFVKPNNGTQILVWNFLNSVNDAKNIGFTLNTMKKYSMSIKFNEIAEGREANLLLYSVNGRDTSWHYLGNDEQVGMIADVCFNGVVNQQYDIPYPTVSDNFKEGTVTVIGPISNETYPLTYNTSFIPPYKGNYSIIYNVVSDKGVATSTEYSIDVIDPNDVSETVFDFSSVLYEGNYGIGSSVYLPDVYVSGGLARQKIKADLCVYVNDEPIKYGTEYSEKYVFNTAGEYRFVFSVMNGNISKTYTFNISNQYPKADALIFDSEVALNDTFVVPSWNLTQNDNKCNYTVRIKKPNGETEQTDTIVADMLGYYTVSYIVDFDNRQVVYNRVFTVRQLTKDMFSSQKQINYESGNAWFNADIKGVILSAGSVFSADYDGIIDLSDNTKNDLLLELSVIPDAIGTENFNKFTITFTDLEDNKNSFSVSAVNGAYYGNSKGMAHVTAKATGQPNFGWQEGRKSRYGTNINFSFSGEYLATERSNKVLRFYYDNDEKAIYVCYLNNDKLIIADFDDPACYSTLWGGLTNGKVRMTVQTQAYFTGNVNLLISVVDGVDLSNKYILDNEPFIDIDLQGYEEDNLPNAVVGKKYNIFNACGQSVLQGVLPVDVSVYYNDGVEPIDISNGFIPQNKGEYTIVYKTQDVYGISSEKALTVNCINASEYRDITSNISHSFDKSLYVGQIDTVKDINLNGGQGKYNLQIILRDENSNDTELKENGTFILEKAGVYNIVYKVKDYLETEKEFAYTITCSISDNPIVNDEASLPNGFIRGFEYKLPELVGYDYSYNGKKLKAQTFILIMNLSEEIICSLDENRLYTPLADHGDAVIVRYMLCGLSGYEIKDYKVVISDAIDLDKSEVDKTKLFVVENVSNVKAEETHIAFTCNDDSRISFINKLTDNNVNFSIGAESSEKNTFIVYLTDSANNKISVRFYAEFSDSKIELYTDNSDQKVSMEGSNIDDVISYSFVYNKRDYTLRTQEGTILLTFKYTVSGETFEGFPSKNVNFDVMTDAVNAAPKFLIFSIGKIYIDSGKDDNIPPQINILTGIKNSATVGETVYVPAVMVQDVISPNSNVLLTVMFRGEAVKDVNGVSLYRVDGTIDYRFIAQQCGNYIIEYYYEDAFGNNDSYSNSVSVIEKDAPVITVEGSLPESVKVGGTVNIPAYKVSDASSADKISSNVYVITPSGVFDLVNDTYTFGKAGKYVVRYVAYDQYYNYSFVDYTIEVVK